LWKSERAEGLGAASNQKAIFEDIAKHSGILARSIQCQNWIVGNMFRQETDAMLV
jgi:hypothetical protein